jgi:O-antigen/teichoic acid export membrane protein
MNGTDASASKKRLTKNVLSLTLVQVANYLMPIISVPIISRIIGPANFGLITFAVAFVTYFVLLVAYGFDYTATRKISRDPDNEENRNRVFSEVFYTQCLLLVAAAVIFAILLYAVPEARVNKTIFIFTFLTVIAGLFTQNWLFQAMQDLSKVAVFNLVSKVLYTVFVLIIVRRNQDYIWQPLLVGTIQVVVSVWSFVWAVRKYRIKFIKVPLSRCRQVLFEDRIIFFSIIFVNVYSNVNMVILGLYQNAEQVGYYAAAQRLITVAQSVLAIPLAQAFYPFAGKAFGGGREQGLRLVQKIVPFILIFLGVACVAMFLLGPLVIRLFYGQKFAPGIPAFQVMAVIPLFYMLNNLLGVQVMVNLAMDKTYFRIVAVTGLLSLILNIATLRYWGYLGCAFNWLVTEMFLFLITYLELRRKQLQPFNKEYFKFSLMKDYMLQSFGLRKP